MQKLSLSVAVLFTSALATVSARAQTFTPRACGPSYNMTFFSSGSAPILRNKDYEPSVTNPSALANSIDDLRYFSANRNVSGIAIKFNSFSLENNWDKLLVGVAGVGVSHTLTGDSPNGNIFGVSVPSWTNMSTNPAYFNLKTDSTQNSTGFSAEVAYAVCGGTGTSVWSTEPGVEQLGVLLGTDDSVELLAFPGASGKRSNFILTSSSGLDADLYVRCNSAPTKVTFSAKSDSWDGEEFITLPSSSCPNGTWYITVHSYSGAGTFSLLASTSAVAQDLVPRVYVMNTLCSEVDNTASLVLKGAKRFYGLTKGGIFTKQIEVCREGNYDCGGDFWVYRRYDCPNSANPSSNGYLRTGPSAPWGITALCNDVNSLIVPHEFGHAVLGLPDEYVFEGTKCGHSEMGHYGANKLCFYDHGKDPLPNTGAPIGGQSMWQRAYPYMAMSGFSRTPPVGVYDDHDFNDQIVVNKHYFPSPWPCQLTRKEPQTMSKAQHLLLLLLSLSSCAENKQKVSASSHPEDANVAATPPSGEVLVEVLPSDLSTSVGNSTIRVKITTQKGMISDEIVTKALGKIQVASYPSLRPLTFSKTIHLNPNVEPHKNYPKEGPKPPPSGPDGGLSGELFATAFLQIEEKDAQDWVIVAYDNATQDAMNYAETNPAQGKSFVTRFTMSSYPTVRRVKVCGAQEKQKLIVSFSEPVVYEGVFEGTILNSLGDNQISCMPNTDAGNPKQVEEIGYVCSGGAIQAIQLGFKQSVVSAGTQKPVTMINGPLESQQSGSVTKQVGETKEVDFSKTNLVTDGGQCRVWIPE